MKPPWSSGYSGLQIPGNPIGPYQADLFMRPLELAVGKS